MEEKDLEGTYRIPVASRILGSSRRVLEDAVPPLSQTQASRTEGEAQGEADAFGWVADAFSSAAGKGRYLVRFRDRSRVQIVAFIDREGRAFATARPLDAPPVEPADLRFARFPEQRDPEREHGCVEVLSPTGKMRRVADYACEQGRYEFSNSWFDFGEHGRDLSYDDAMARAYFAFVYRPAHGGAQPVPCGFSSVDEALARLPLAVALEHIEADVRRAEYDRALRVPALMRLFARWLGEAEAHKAAQLPQDGLSLVRTARYADLYYVAVSETVDEPWAERFAWALEGALNRFKLVRDALGESAFTADVDECERADACLAWAMAAGADAGADPEEAQGTGEWDARRRIAAGIENLKAPARLTARFQVDLAQGVAAFYIQTPDATLMPKSRWDEGARMHRNRRPLELADEAADFAMAAGAACAKVAFAASARIDRVEVACAYLDDAVHREAAQESGAFLKARALARACRATFSREAFRTGMEGAEQAVRGAQAGGAADAAEALRALYRQAGGTWSRPGEADAAPDAADDPADVLDLATDPESAKVHRAYPEAADGLLPEAARSRLGARYLRDARITSGSVHRSAAEELASSIERCASDREAVDIVRAYQRRAQTPFDVEAANRVMAAIAAGTASRTDKNAVVERFMGDDAYFAALTRSRELAEAGDENAAVNLLLETIEGAEAREGFADDSEVVHRSFDSYIARLAYNLARTGALELPSMAGRFDFVGRDAGKRVEIVPDSLYLDYLEAVGVLSRSFSGADDAVRLGERAVQMAPTVAVGYRQLARACMLTGDVESAEAALRCALEVAARPIDAAIGYYQLGYVLWEMDRAQAGALCYLKSAAAGPFVALQAMQELRELARKNRDVSIVARDRLDEALAEQGVVVAPTEALLDAALEGAAAATDAGMFLVARSLLETRLAYRPDDALVNLAVSLEEPLL